MEELVSIIMPAYNCEKFVTASINSVLAQTYKNYELIVIDDGSNDETMKILDEFSKSDVRIRLYANEKNQGVSATRNRGVSLAKGSWIAFLDSDDCWEKVKLTKQLIYAKETGADFIFSGSSFIDEESRPYSGILEVPEKVSFQELVKQNVISCSSVLIKKSYMEKYKMEKDDTHEDFGSWLRILKIKKFAYGINEPLLIYRISSNSKSSNKLKSLGMAYRTYRFVGINPIFSLYYLIWYIIKGVKKYRNINIARI